MYIIPIWLQVACRSAVVVTFVAEGSVNFQKAAVPVLRALALCSIQVLPPLSRSSLSMKLGLVRFPRQHESRELQGTTRYSTCRSCATAQAMAVMRWEGRAIFDASGGIYNVTTVDVPLSMLRSLLETAVPRLSRSLPAIPDRVVWYT